MPQNELTDQQNPAQTSQPPARQQQNPATAFRRQAQQIAGSLLTEWVGEERAAEAKGRISVALSSARAAARDPSDFDACTPQSVAAAIATAALTGIMPGTGSTALAYVIPQRPRKGEPPQLQYRLSHRGINALARRCGQQMTAVPIGYDDEMAVRTNGNVEITHRDLDNPPIRYEDLRGVVVIVQNLDTAQLITSQFVPKSVIDERRQMSLSKDSKYGPWHNWPVPMAMKTAMHYTISRGWCVIDDTEASRALSMDPDQQSATIDVVPEQSSRARLTERLAEEPQPQSEEAS